MAVQMWESVVQTQGSFTSAELCEQQELSLPRVRLLFPY